MKQERVFISYRRANGGLANAYILYQRLLKLGINCFLDMEELKDNKDFDERLQKEIEASDYIIVMLQPGCMKSKQKKGYDDYYLKEIRIATKTPEKMMFVATPEFAWENEKVPKDLKAITKLNIVSKLEIDKLSYTINNIVSSMKNAQHYLLLNELLSNSKFYENARIFHTLGDVISIDIKKRWQGAKRISLLAMGCTSVVSRDLAPYVYEMFNNGVEFRLLAVNPDSPHIDYIQKSRLNNYVESDSIIREYCRDVTSSVKKMVEGNPEGVIEYRLTDEVIDFTIQLVECENEENNYILVEFVPVKATGVIHSSNPCITLQKGDNLYDYYINQFDLIWENAKVNFINGK